MDCRSPPSSSSPLSSLSSSCATFEALVLEVWFLFLARTLRTFFVFTPASCSFSNSRSTAAISASDILLHAQTPVDTEFRRVLSVETVLICEGFLNGQVEGQPTSWTPCFNWMDFL